MVSKLAKKKCDRAHDREDLFQEGRIIVFQLIPMCQEWLRLTAYLKKSLPYRMEDAANKLRYWKWTVSQDGIGYQYAVERDENGEIKVREENVFAERELSEKGLADDEAAWLEYEQVLRSVLTAEQVQMVRMRLAGMTHREMAVQLHIGRDSVTKRMKAIGEKMLPYLKRGASGRG